MSGWQRTELANFTIPCNTCGQDWYPSLADLRGYRYKCRDCRNAEKRVWRAERAALRPDRIRRRPWTEEELALVREGRLDVPGRTRKAVHLVRQEMIRRGEIEPIKPRRLWTEAELAYLREHFGKVPGPQIAKALGRNVLCVWAKAQRLKLRSDLRSRPKSEIPRLTTWWRRKVPHLVEAAVPTWLDPEMRAVIVRELTADVLARKVPRQAIPQVWKFYRARYYGRVRQP